MNQNAESVRVPCVCCGVTVDDADQAAQPACGHLFCWICLGRGHETHCIACEDASAQNDGSGVFGEHGKAQQ